MKKVGITGGMGCGKSTVVAEFMKRGVPAFVADKAGAACYEDPRFLADLRQLFGPSVFAPDGTADKRRIAERVFADRQVLLELNALVHPRVMEAFERFCDEHRTAPYVLFESAILYDYGFDRLMDSVICVYLQLEERLARLEARDGLSRSQLMARIDSQLPVEEMMRRADYVILNYEGNPRARQVRYVDGELRIKN